MAVQEPTGKRAARRDGPQRQRCRGAALCVTLCLAFTAAQARDRPPGPQPHPDRTDAFTAWMFELYGCEMTEDELFMAYQAAGTGLLGASRAVIALSTRSDVLRRDGIPPVYRFYGSTRCKR